MAATQATDIYIFIALATLAFLLIPGFIVFVVLSHQKKILAEKNARIEREAVLQKEMLDIALNSAEEERIRVACNLHDDLGLKVTSARIQLNIINNKIKDQEIKEAIKDVIAIADENMETIRALRDDLAPPFHTFGLVKAMEVLCMDLRSENLSLSFDSDCGELKIEPVKCGHLYRMVCELLNNVIKHAKPAHIQMEVKHMNNRLITSVTHNGKGVSGEQIESYTASGSGLGLKNIKMRERITGSKINYLTGGDRPSIIINTPL